jgi:Cu/Ag efflux protein CusF
MKSMFKFGLLGALAIAIAAMPVQAQAQTNSMAPEKKASKRAGLLPFHGKLKAVDSKAKTISVGEMTIQVTSETKIFKAGKPATLADGVVGEDVSGSYKKADDGKLTAVRVTFGPRPEKAGATKEEKKDQ